MRAGDDEVAGGDGNSLDHTLVGGQGNDTLDGGINNDTCEAGPGNTATRCETVTGAP